MSPSEAKAKVKQQYYHLRERAHNREINRSAIPRLVQAYCEKAAFVAGGHWKDYWPEGLEPV